MRTRIVRLMTILMMGFAGLQSSHAQNNILVNGGFEDGVADPWGIHGGSSMEVVNRLVGAAVPEDPFEGKSCLHVVTAKTANWWDTALEQGITSFEAGKKYTLSAFLKCKTGTAQINFKPEHGADPYTGYGEQQFTMTDQWAEYSVTTPVFTSAVSPASITFHVGFATTEFWMDGIRFYEGDYVPPVFKPKGSADTPNPEDGATDVPRDVILSWEPGPYANTHNVYLGTTFGDVNSANVSSANVLASPGLTKTTYDPDGLLEFSQTYYWRVDEVNAPPDSTVYKGDVWSFTTEPFAYPLSGANIIATASSAGQADFGPEKTIDGSGLDADDLHSTNAADMWLSNNEPSGAWIQYEFDKVYKLHEMWVWNSNQVFEPLFGFGFKDVTVEYSADGTEWTTLADVPQFAKAPGTAGYAHDTTVDLGGAMAKYVKLSATSNWGGVLPQYSLSEVRFFYIPVIAREPSPASGAADVDPDVILAWRTGREAAKHNVYLSTDEQTVIDGSIPPVTATSASYSAALDLGSTYYWRVDEVNEAETPTTWQGNVWSFSTSEYLVVDDFEFYNDLDPPDPESHRIFESWSDGYDVVANGALVGNDLPPYTETVTVRNGIQSMPLFYSNTGGATYSEVTRTFSAPQDWTQYGAQTLVLYIHGTPGNTGQLYAKINGVKVAYPGNAADIARLMWNQWNIDLASLGISPKNVTTLAIGIDGNGAAGTLYVDDIVLYRSAPPQPTEQIYLEAEAGTITAPMTVRDDPLASGGQYIGTDNGIGDENNNPPADGIATYNFMAQGGVYRISLRVIITGGSNSFWVRIPGATNYDPGTHSSGWIRFNDISDGAAWHWDEVHSSDHNNEVVSITVPAGPQTLEIARREDGALLDVIVISKID